MFRFLSPLIAVNHACIVERVMPSVVGLSYGAQANLSLVTDNEFGRLAQRRSTPRGQSTECPVLADNVQLSLEARLSVVSG